MSDKKNVYVTVAGVEVPIGPVNLFDLNLAAAGLEKEYRERGEPLDPPTYAAELAGGGTQTFEHDEDTLEVTPEMVVQEVGEAGIKAEEAERIASERTIANREAWADYLNANARLIAEQSALRMEIMLDGVKAEIPEDGAWEARRRRRHLEVPDDPAEKRLYWIQRELLVTPADAEEALAAIIRLSSQGMPEEAIKAAEAMFRHQVQAAFIRPERSGDTPGGSEDEAGPVVAQPKVRRRSRGKKLGADTQPVPDAIAGGPGGDGGA